jgi:hypothetical protein
MSNHWSSVREILGSVRLDFVLRLRLREDEERPLLWLVFFVLDERREVITAHERDKMIVQMFGSLL